jgi:hypothetical protein
MEEMTTTMPTMIKNTKKEGVAQAEDAPAYTILQRHGLLDASYRKEHFEDIFDSPDDFTPNSSKDSNLFKKIKWGVYFTPGCGFILYVSSSSAVMYCTYCKLSVMLGTDCDVCLMSLIGRSYYILVLNASN